LPGTEILINTYIKPSSVFKKNIYSKEKLQLSLIVKNYQTFNIIGIVVWANVYCIEGVNDSIPEILPMPINLIFILSFLQNRSHL